MSAALLALGGALGLTAWLMFIGVIGHWFDNRDRRSLGLDTGPALCIGCRPELLEAMRERGAA